MKPSQTIMRPSQSYEKIQSKLSEDPVKTTRRPVYIIEMHARVNEFQLQYTHEKLKKNYNIKTLFPCLPRIIQCDSHK